MKVECILDTCPQDNKFVNHLKCSHCKYNPLGNKQPQFAWQECKHPNATHNPNHKRWQDMKACGIESLTLMVTR